MKTKGGRFARREERGAAAVTFALLMSVMLVGAGLAIDIGSAMHHKQLLRNGADAAAMALAQECGAGACSDERVQAIAQQMVDANALATSAETTVDVQVGESTVRVDASATHRNSFGPIVGADKIELGAASAAEWGYPSAVNAVLPYALSMCVVEEQGGITAVRENGLVVGFDLPVDPEVAELNPGKDSPGCMGNDGKLIPGGFGWLVPDSGCGETLSVVDETVSSSTGNTPHSNCSNADFQQWVGKLVLVPVFDQAAGNGSKATYTVLGHIGFRLSGYHLGGQYNAGPPCAGDPCMAGTFERFVSLSDSIELDPDGPRLGAAVARFVLP